MSTRWRRILRVCLLVGAGLALLYAVDTRVSAAQSTGGSMGGGSFGGGGGGGGGGYSGGGGGYSGGGGGSYSGNSSGGGSSSDGGAVAGLVFGLVIVLAIMLMGLTSSSRATTRPGQQPEPIDVSVLSVALDSRARPALQKRFAEIAASCDTGTTAGLVQMLREVSIELRRFRSSWLYVGAVNASPMIPQLAEAHFQKLVGRARSGYRHELVRATHGKVKTNAAPGLVPRTDEGPGLVLVTIAVAAHGELFDVTTAEPDHIRRALEGLSALSVFRLAVVEVIWTPAADSDRMSSIELETLYPHMVKIPESVAGKVVCGFCGGGFPAELLSCPHCGGVVAEV